jgi:hypothetical protein
LFVGEEEGCLGGFAEEDLEAGLVVGFGWVPPPFVGEPGACPCVHPAGWSTMHFYSARVGCQEISRGEVDRVALVVEDLGGTRLREDNRW